MKKMIAFMLVAAVMLGTLGFILGCGSTTETTLATTTTSTTTTTSANAAQVNAAKAGVLVASGGSSVGTSASGVGSSAGAKIMSIKATTTAGPPASFFTSLLTGTASIDGYLSPTTESIGGNMTPYMRLKTVGGSVINGAFLTGKKIAKFVTLEVSDIMGAGENQMVQGMTAEVSSYVTRYITAYITGGVHPFTDATLFRAISTEADYMAWMFMYPSIEAGVSAMAVGTPGAPSHIYMATPEVTASQKIGGMEMKMVFSKSATGEISLLVSTEATGRPIAALYSGAGTLTVPSGSLETTLSMNFTTAGPPSWLRFVGTTEATPKYTVIVIMSPATMSATGEVRDSSGTRIGTIEGTSAGGKVYLGATTEAFTF